MDNEYTDIVWMSSNHSVILFTENQVDCYLEALEQKDEHAGITFHKIQLDEAEKKSDLINSFEKLIDILEADCKD